MTAPQNPKPIRITDSIPEQVTIVEQETNQIDKSLSEELESMSLDMLDDIFNQFNNIFKNKKP